MKYRKKPVVVEAYKTDKDIVIHTLEGDMKTSIGDYIIAGINGEQYPCKPDIFEKTYEVINNTNYDKIKAKIANMSIDELSKLLSNSDFCEKFCAYTKNGKCNSFNYDSNSNCVDGIKQWLEQEVSE